MLFAMLMLGLLLGAAATATVALFAILSMEGRFSDNLRDVATTTLRRMAGRAPRTPSASGVGRNIESDNRIRALQEEARVMQKLIDQTRVERDAARGQIDRASQEQEALKATVSSRDERIAALDATIKTEAGKLLEVREQGGAMQAEIIRLRGEIRDLETELSVAQSNVGLATVGK